MRSLMLLLPVLFIGGCATTDYNDYLKANKEIEVARETANAAKYTPMSAIANDGDNTAKVAAVLAMALDKQGSATNSNLQAPSPNILVPGLTQGGGMCMNYKTSVVQSNNAANVAMKTNGAFVAMGNNVTGVANAGVAGMVGISNSGNTGFTSVTGVANSGISGITGVANVGMNNLNNLGNTAINALKITPVP